MNKVKKISLLLNKLEQNYSLSNMDLYLALGIMCIGLLMLGTLGLCKLFGVPLT